MGGLRAVALATACVVLVGCQQRSEARDAEQLQLFCVSPTGSDLNDGSCSTPWKTIQKAVDTLRGGQTALLRAGVYRERVLVTRGGGPRGSLSLRAYGGERAILRGQLKIRASFVRVTGLEVDGSGINLRGPLVYVDRGRSVRLERLEVRNSPQSGIFAGGGAREVTVIGCWVHGNGRRPRFDNGIAFSRGTGGMIASNLVERTVGGGVLIYPGFDGVVVNQNTIVRNSSFGILVGGNKNTSDDAVVVNNILSMNGGQGIRTFWRRATGTGNIAVNNLIWDNGENDVSREGIQQQDNIRAAPRFVDVAKGNYRLARRSGAVGQALPQYVAAIDRDGRQRPAGLRPDLGAFER
jgi:Right handed beta helix region